MPCYHPLAAWRSKTVGASGKRGITFSLADGFKEMPVSLPCGTCVGCRLEKARQWSVRCMHEVKCWDESLFVTLTYDDGHLKWAGPRPTLFPRDMVLFLKRLRNTGRKVRYFQCGEYGETLERPHHHALLFNCSFTDKVRYRQSNAGDWLYVSKELNSLWENGECFIGSATFESAGYIARYTLKKVVGTPLDYGCRVPEYLTMSRKPGIGYGWAMKYWKEWLRGDSVVVNGVEAKVPRYYENLMEKEDPKGLWRAKVKRKLDEAHNLPGYVDYVPDVDSTASRLVVREEVKKAAIATLTRKVE